MFKLFNKKSKLNTEYLRQLVKSKKSENENKRFGEFNREEKSFTKAIVESATSGFNSYSRSYEYEDTADYIYKKLLTLGLNSSCRSAGLSRPLWYVEVNWKDDESN